MGKGFGKMAGLTGKALEKGVHATEKVADASKPFVKAVAKETKKGVVLAKDETLKAAKKLKEKDTS